LSQTEYKKREKIATADDVRKIRKEVIQGTCKNPDVAVITGMDLQRIKHSAKILTKEEKIAQQKILAEQEEKQQSRAQAKKQKMIELEQEKKRVAPVLSDIEREDIDKRDAAKKRAEEIMNENRDEVKHMNQLVSEKLRCR